MVEQYPSDADLNALSGTNDAEQEVLFVTTGESPYYTSFYKMLHRLLNVARRAGDLRVYKDGDLTFGVRTGRYLDGDTAINYAGASAQALTDNQTNYIYLTAGGTLTVNTTGFPTPSTTPHVPLATILTASGDYDCLTDITDYRGRSIFTVAAGLSPALAAEAAAFFGATDISGAEAEDLTDGGNADALHTHSTNGIEAGAVAYTNLNTNVAGDGLQGGETTALAVDVSDFAGEGTEDDGSENLRVKLDGSTLARSASGLKVADGGIANTQIDAAAAIARSKLAQDAAKVYVVPLTEMRIWDAVHTLLPATAGGGTDDMALITGTFGTDVPTLQSSDFDGGGMGDTTNAKCRFFFALPAEYDDGETITVRIYGHMITTVASVHSKVDVECFVSDQLGAAVADICDTAAQSINSLSPTPEYVDFTITPAGLAAGDLLDIRLSFDGSDVDDTGVTIAEISQVELLLDVKG